MREFRNDAIHDQQIVLYHLPINTKFRPDSLLELVQTAIFFKTSLQSRNFNIARVARVFQHFVEQYCRNLGHRITCQHVACQV